MGFSTILATSALLSGTDPHLEIINYTNRVDLIERVRPLSEREIEHKEDSIIDVMDPEQILLRPNVRPNGTNALGTTQSSFNQSLVSKSFTFNAVFDSTASQSELMQRSGIARIIEMAMDGYSTTVFCYGQTGSGKTHTLTGPPSLVLICHTFIYYVSFISTTLHILSLQTHVRSLTAVLIIHTFDATRLIVLAIRLMHIMHMTRLLKVVCNTMINEVKVYNLLSKTTYSFHYSLLPFYFASHLPNNSSRSSRINGKWRWRKAQSTHLATSYWSTATN